MEDSITSELAVEPVREGVFRARLPGFEGRTFGGTTLGCAVLAAAHGCEGALHPLHAYFLRRVPPDDDDRAPRRETLRRAAPRAPAGADPARRSCAVRGVGELHDGARRCRLSRRRHGCRHPGARGAAARRRAREARGLAGAAASGRVALDRVSVAGDGSRRGAAVPRLGPPAHAAPGRRRACTRRRWPISATGPRRAPSSAATRAASRTSAS